MSGLQIGVLRRALLVNQMSFSRLSTLNVQFSYAVIFKKITQLKCRTNEKRNLSEHDEKNFKREKWQNTKIRS